MLLGTAIGAAFGGARGALAGAVAGGGAGLASVHLHIANGVAGSALSRGVDMRRHSCVYCPFMSFDTYDVRVLAIQSRDVTVETSIQLRRYLNQAASQSLPMQFR